MYKEYAFFWIVLFVGRCSFSQRKVIYRSPITKISPMSLKVLELLKSHIQIWIILNEKVRITFSLTPVLNSFSLILSVDVVVLN